MNTLKNLIARILGVFAVLALATNSALATAGPVEAAATTMVGDAKTAGENILVVAIGVLAAFVIFKLVKRGVSKV